MAFLEDLVNNIGRSLGIVQDDKKKQQRRPQPQQRQQLQMRQGPAQPFALPSIQQRPQQAAPRQQVPQFTLGGLIENIGKASRPISQGGINAFADAGNFVEDVIVKPTYNDIVDYGKQVQVGNELRKQGVYTNLPTLNREDEKRQAEVKKQVEKKTGIRVASPEESLRLATNVFALGYAPGKPVANTLKESADEAARLYASMTPAQRQAGFAKLPNDASRQLPKGSNRNQGNLPEQSQLSDLQTPQLPSNARQINSAQNKAKQQLQVPQSQDAASVMSSFAKNTTKTPSSQLKQRGFAETVSNSAMTDNALRTAVDAKNLTYKTRNTANLTKRAATLVKEDADSAYRMAINGSDDKALAVGQELVKKYQKEGNYQQAISLIENISKKATESGRAAQILSAYNKLTPEGALRFTQRQIDQYNEFSGITKNGKALPGRTPAKLSPERAKRISDIADEVQKLPDGEAKDALTQKLLQEMNSAAPTPLLQKATSIWRAGLLTSLRTLEGGVLGNASKQVLDIPSNAIAAGIDRFITAPLNNGVRSNVFTLKGGAKGFGEGVQRGREYFKTGIDPRDVEKGYENSPINYEDGNKFVNAVGKASDYVYRAMGTVDNPFYYSALRRANREEALLEASRQGLKGAEKKAFVDEFTANPSSEAAERAILKAQDAVFQNDTALGTIAAQVKRAPQSIKNPQSRAAAQAAVDFIIPFSKIPSAVATALVDYSPAGAGIQGAKAIFSKALKRPVDIENLNKSIGKSATGSALGIGVGMQAYNAGAFTLEAPNDPSERQLWELEGKKPFSVRIGDRWYGLNYIQPLGSLMAIGAGYERAKANGEQPLPSAIASGLKAVTEQSFLQGVSGAISAVQDPARSAGTFANSTVGSFIPNIVRDAARATDGTERETNTPLDALRAGIPGLRQQNLPQRDPFGREIERRQSALGTFADPFKSTQAKNDPLTAEMRRLYDIDPTDADYRTTPTKLTKQQSLGGKKAVLTPEQLDEFEQLVGTPAAKVLNETIRSDEYKKLSDADKAKNLKKQISAIRNNEKQTFAEGNVGYLKDKYGKVIDFSDARFSNRSLDITKSKETKATGLSGSTSSSSRSTSVKGYEDMTADERKQSFSKTPDAEYKYLKAKYDQDEKDGKISEISRIRRQSELAKAEVGSKYDKKVRDLYSLSKAQIYEYVSKNKDGKKLADQLVAYADDLVEKGINKYSKFRNRYGVVSVAPVGRSSSGRRSSGGRRRSSGGRRGGGTGKKNLSAQLAAMRKADQTNISLTTRAQSAVTNAKVRKASLPSTGKIAKRGFEQYKKGKSTKVSMTRRA